jgi:hypothetical protein
MNTNKPQAFSRCGSPGSKLFGSKTAAAAPVLSTLIQVFAVVESEMRSLERNTEGVAELRHAGRDVARWALNYQPSGIAARALVERAGGIHRSSTR